MDNSLSSGANTFSHPCGCAELPDTISRNPADINAANTSYSTGTPGTLHVKVQHGIQLEWLLNSRWLHKNLSVHPEA